MDEEWFFTFGFGHYTGGLPLRNRYVVFTGNFIEARKKMFDIVGPKWAMQYPISDLEDQELKYRLLEIKPAEIGTVYTI